MFVFVCFSRSQDTVLGETGDPHELFEVDQCDNNPLGAIIDKVEVCLIIVNFTLQTKCFVGESFDCYIILM